MAQMIKLTTGYKTPRGLAGLSFGDPGGGPPSTDYLTPLVGQAVVWGGIPLCALILFRVRGPIGMAAGALGAGLAWLGFTGRIETELPGSWWLTAPAPLPPVGTAGAFDPATGQWIPAPIFPPGEG